MLVRRFFIGLLTMVAVLGVQVAVGPSANAAPCYSRGQELGPGGALQIDQCLMSSNGRYGVKMHRNGSLALWDFQAPRLCWQTSQERTPVAGDKMYFTTLYWGRGYTDSAIRLRPSSSGTVHYQKVYTDYVAPGVGRSYSASVNNSGQFWVGYDLHRSC